MSGANVRISKTIRVISELSPGAPEKAVVGYTKPIPISLSTYKPAQDSALSSADEEAFAEHPQESERKFPMQEWIADTGASTHMTDQLHLFRGP
jgi:hypothetical protein